MNKQIISRIFFLSIFFLPSLAQAYTETFYVCKSGDGSAPEVANCATAFNELAFNSSHNWASIVANDGKIGPGDIVYFMDDGGTYTATLTVQQSGLSGKPITLAPASGDSPEFQPTSNTSLSSGGNDYISLLCDNRMTFYSDTSISGGASINFVRSQYPVVDSCIVDGSTNVTNSSSYATPGIAVCESGGNNITVTNNTVSGVSLGIKCGFGAS